MSAGLGWILAAMAVACPVLAAQESDSTLATAPVELAAGRVPAAEPLLSLEPLAAEMPHRFLYDLGSTGFPHGVGAYGLRPEQQSLTLDGVPFDDPFTGRARFDLLPLELLGELDSAPAFGYAAGTAAQLRPLPAPVARTELRYVTGQEGTQHIGATHAQDRRPGFVGEEGRLGLLAHVSGRDANGYYDASDTGGFRALGRLRLIRPGYTVEVVELQQRQSDEARSGVSSFDPSAAVAGAGTERETVRNDLWASVRKPAVLGGDLVGSAFWTVQRSSYSTPDTAFTQRSARGTRVGARLAYGTAAGPHSLQLSATAWRDGAVEGRAITNPSARAFAEARVQDEVRLGALEVRAEGAAQYMDGGVVPSAAFTVGRPGAGLTATARLSHLLPSRLAGDGGFGIAGGAKQRSRVVSAEAAWRRPLGPFGLRLNAYALQQRRLSSPAFDPAGVGDADSIAVLSDGSALLRFGTEGGIGWRAEAEQGPYAWLTASAQSGSAESALGERLLQALPDYWGRATIGWRATGVFAGVLDLDAAVGGRYWPAFQSLGFHAPSALFALPASGAPPVPSSATLDARLSARVQRRASVFLLYQNALGTRAVSGSYVVPIFPITPHQLSFGVFWTLLN